MGSNDDHTRFEGMWEDAVTLDVASEDFLTEDEGAELPMGDLLRGTSYRAMARLGRGGMGEIYEAERLDTGERVVVKLLHRALLPQVDMVDRMRVEAEALLALSHPNIVRGLAFGTTADGRPYLVLERLQGCTLQNELRERGTIPVLEAIGYVRQLLAALRTVHEAGIVHRDVKPDNVMLTGEAGKPRTLKLLDFGVAKITDSAIRSVGLVPLAFPTMAGTCVGTPRYASPEQARGTCVDERSDIYAAGIVLYTLLAGCGPFDQIKGTVPVLRAHVSEEPLPPSHYTPAPFPPELDLVVMKAIAKRAEDRYPDAVSFSRALTLVVGRLCVPLSEMLTAQWASERDAKGSANDAPIEPVDFDAPTMFCCDEELHALRRATPTECEIRTVAAPAPATCEGAKDALGSPRVSVSRVEVLVSAAAFAALASGLAHWFVR